MGVSRRKWGVVAPYNPHATSIYKGQQLRDQTGNALLPLLTSVVAIRSVTELEATFSHQAIVTRKQKVMESLTLSTL